MSHSSDGPLPNDIRLLMEDIGRIFSFTAEKYPPLLHVANEATKREFAVNHSLKHLVKSTGKIASQCEDIDHGGVMNEETLKVCATKLVLSSLNLANVLGLSAEELLHRMARELH